MRAHRSERFRDWTYDAVACDGAGERDRVGDALVDNREAWLGSRDPLIALWAVFRACKEQARP